MPQPGDRRRTATGSGSSGRRCADRDLRGGRAGSAVRMQPGCWTRCPALRWDRATRAVLSRALRCGQGEVRESPRTGAATPRRPDRLSMWCVEELATSSGTLASTSGCRPQSTSVRTGTTERLPQAARRPKRPGRQAGATVRVRGHPPMPVRPRAARGRRRCCERSAGRLAGRSGAAFAVKMRRCP